MNFSASVDDLSVHYAVADLVVSRAGATSLAELACWGCAMILVPYPYAVDDHQRANAQPFVDAGAAAIVPQSRDATPDPIPFRKTLDHWLDSPAVRQSARAAALQLAYPNAAMDVARRALELIDHGTVGPHES